MKKLVVVDIDGVVANVQSMTPFPLTSENHADWSMSCLTCFPHNDIISMVRHLSKQYTIVFCTARPIEVWEETMYWLRKHVNIGKPVHLLMRRLGDHRSDGIVKVELLRDNNITPENTLMVLDDSDSVCYDLKMYGYRVLQVKPKI